MSLPTFLVSSPDNRLLKEIKNSFLLIDPVNFSSEISREFLYANTTFLKFDLLKNFLIVTNNGIANSSVNLSSINNYLFFYLFGGLNNSNTLGNNSSLFKNQFSWIFLPQGYYIPSVWYILRSVHGDMRTISSLNAYNCLFHEKGFILFMMYPFYALFFYIRCV